VGIDEGVVFGEVRRAALDDELGDAALRAASLRIDAARLRR
jgi:hypothetical protein